MNEKVKGCLVGLISGIVTALILIYVFYYVLPFEQEIFVYLSITAGIVVASAVECAIGRYGFRTFFRRTSLTIIAWSIAYILIAHR